MADQPVLNLPTGLDRIRHHFTGVDTDAGFERAQPFSGATLLFRAQLSLHIERRIQRALRMVLIRCRRAEQREDTVAGRPCDVTLVAPHRFDHDAQRRIDDCVRRLGVEVFHQLRRPLEVREERRDDPPLALEIFRGRGLNYANRWIIRFLCRGSRRRHSERRAALATKAFTRWVIGATLRTQISEGRAAVAAEFLARRIFSFAIRAAHVSSSLLAATQQAGSVARQLSLVVRTPRHGQVDNFTLVALTESPERLEWRPPLFDDLFLETLDERNHVTLFRLGHSELRQSRARMTEKDI